MDLGEVSGMQWVNAEQGKENLKVSVSFALH